MKLTKKRLKQIIKEEIQKLNEGLPWEQGLDEGWFSDLKAKAQQAYINANPNSKYAKGEKSKKEKPKSSFDPLAHMSKSDKTAKSSDKSDDEEKTKKKKKSKDKQSSDDDFGKKFTGGLGAAAL